LDRGVLFHPGAYENLFVSFAHNQQDIDETLIAARETARTLRRYQLR
jgi:glutamate-1-semialdehyde 2,1-aminomutase